MIEAVIDWSVRNRWFVIILYVLVSSVALSRLNKIPIDAIPDLSENQVIVYTEWMGRSPETMERLITYPLVSAFQGMPMVKAVRASSMFGMSFVFVIFEDETDLYFARSRVLEKISTLRSILPEGVVPTLGPDGTGVGHIFWYTVESSRHDLDELRAIQDWEIRYYLAAVEGVAEVASIGGFVRQYQVDLDPGKLRAYGLTVRDVVMALQRNNTEVGGKILELSDAEYYVRGQGYYRTTEQIENTLVGFRGSQPVWLKELAVVQMGADIRRGALEKNGQGQVVGGVVVMRHGENARAVIERVRQRIEQISPSLPEGVQIHIAYDRSELIDAAVQTLQWALIEAALIVTVVVSIFLLHWRSILRILLEIPVSVLMGFLLMDISGITSNIMSLGGIILAIGVIVDSSIVMVENAYRHMAEAIRQKGTLSTDERIRISLMAARQVGRAIFFSEMIILVSFLPVFLLSGQEGKLFTPLAWTKSFVMLSSAVIVITLIPVLMTFVMQGTFISEERHPLTRWIRRLYQPLLSKVLQYRKTSLLVSGLVLISVIPMIADTGSEFMPPLDEGSILYMPVTLPNASLPEVNQIMQLQNQIIRTIPEVALVLGKSGKAETATDNAPVSMIETIILLKPRSEWRPGVSKNDLIQEMDQRLQIPGVRNGWTQPIINRINMLATGVRTDIGLKIFGADPDTLEYYAIEAERLLRTVHGAADVVAERMQKGYYLDIHLKREVAAQYGLDVQDLQETIELAIGGKNLGLFIDGRRRFPIRARLMRDYRSDPEALGALLIPVRYAAPTASMQNRTPEPSGTAMGDMNPGGNGIRAMNGNEPSNETNPGAYIPLSMIADIHIIEGPPMLNSENGMLRSVVYMNARGEDLGSVVEAAQAIIREQLRLPAGYTVAWTGQYEQKIQAQQRILWLMPMVWLIIFLLLFKTLRDFRETLVVMLSVPFALTGGMIMIYLLGYHFSVAVWVGFIAIYGIAVETGVVMVIYLHEALDRRIREWQNGQRGPLTKEDILEATQEGSLLRLRPKLMTVATSMMALIPVMWSAGTGADVMKPLTAPMIGGLITSSAHVLLITPLLFVMMKENALKKNQLRLSRMAPWMTEK